eukprot:COSAG06_NODE_14_length_35011_cov_20.984132_25_plen_65_part_00
MRVGPAVAVAYAAAVVAEEVVQALLGEYQHYIHAQLALRRSSTPTLSAAAHGAGQGDGCGWRHD